VKASQEEGMCTTIQQSNKECGRIERKDGGDLTRCDALSEAEAVGGRVGSRRSPGVRQLAGGRH
jgi:hypothetical protein